MLVPHKASPQQLDQIGAAAAALVQDGDRVGLGSGNAARAFVRALGRRVAEQKIKILGVPTSNHTQRVAEESGVPLTTLDQVDALDIAVDGADEVDPEFNLLKGGGGNLTREKVVASIAKRFVIVVGEEKIVKRLGAHYPVFVEVIEFARPVAIRKLQALGAAVEQRRNPDGSPFLTDNGNPYLHCTFGPAPNHTLDDPAAIDAAIHRIPGVVETGLFISMANEILIAKSDGTVEHKHF